MKMIVVESLLKRCLSSQWLLAIIKSVMVFNGVDIVFGHFISSLIRFRTGLSGVLLISVYFDQKTQNNSCTLHCIVECSVNTA